jgi:hypothetical protein
MGIEKLENHDWGLSRKLRNETVSETESTGLVL